MALHYIFFIRYSKVLLSFLILISFSGYAQEDSLKHLVHINGRKKISQLEQWCNNKLFFNKPPNKKVLLNKLEQIAINSNDKITQASVTFYRGLYVMAMDSQQHKKGIAMMHNAIAMAEKNGQQLQVAYFKHSLGYYYFTGIKNPAKALENMLQAHYIFKKVGYKNVYNPAAMLDRLGYVYYHLSNFNEAVKYFKLSLKNPMENQRRRIGILNSIGLTHRELFETDSAWKYFKKSRDYAVLANDTAWIGINSGNIAQLYIREKKYALAKPFMQEYYESSRTVKDNELIVEALVGLGEISLNSGNIAMALKQLKQAEVLFERELSSADMPMQNYLRKQHLFKVLSKAIEANGNSGQALYYLEEASQIRDSVERRARLSKNTLIQQMFEAQQASIRLQLLDGEKQEAIIKQKLYIILGISLTIIIILLYNRQFRERKIQKQKQALLKLEKENAENELHSSRVQLEEYLQRLRQKAQLIEKIQSEIDHLRKIHPVPPEEEHGILHNLSLATILTEDDWKRFRILFEKVNAGFFVKLKIAHPGLTPAETRLCSLVKLGLSSHQMSTMMGISVDSVKKNRQRLRKKVNLSKEQKLEELFSGF